MNKDTPDTHAHKMFNEALVVRLPEITLSKNEGEALEENIFLPPKNEQFIFPEVTCNLPLQIEIKIPRTIFFVLLTTFSYININTPRKNCLCF